MHGLMPGLWVLLLLIFISAIPVIAVYCWFRVSRYPFSSVRFLVVLLAGAAAFFPALVMQYYFPVFQISGKWALLTRIFSRFAFTEELSRLIVLIVVFWVNRRLIEKKTSLRYSPAELGYNEVSRGTAVGLVAGLGFAVLESAYYGAANAGVTLLRAFTASPLHGACGSRVGAAAVMFRSYPAQGFFRFLSAVLIHGIYNFLVTNPGFPSIAAVLIALSALASSIMTIRTVKTETVYEQTR